MGVSTERTNSAQLAMFFPVAKPRGKTMATLRWDSAKFPSAICLRSEITSRLRRHAVCSLAKMFQDIKKANSVGYSYYLSELFKIFNAHEETGKVKMDKLPTPEQVKQAHSLILRLGLSYAGYSKKNDNFKWRAVTPEQQHAASAKEHLSTLCTIAGLNSLLKEGEHNYFMLVFDSLEKSIMKKARNPVRFGEPRVSGHEVRFCMEVRSSGIPEKVEKLSHLERIQ